MILGIVIIFVLALVVAAMMPNKKKYVKRDYLKNRRKYMNGEITDKEYMAINWQIFLDVNNFRKYFKNE